MGSNTKYTSQHIDNQSFDETFQVKTVELVARNADNTAVEYVRPATEETQAGLFATRIDDVSTTGVTYIGKAPIGSIESDAVWQIRKLDESGTPTTLSITWADGNSNFDNVWSDRLTESYS